STSARKARTASRSVTSAARARTSEAPRARASSATRASSSPRRASSARRAPFPPSCTASSAPMPDGAAVITTRAFRRLFTRAERSAALAAERDATSPLEHRDVVFGALLQDDGDALSGGSQRNDRDGWLFEQRDHPPRRVDRSDLDRDGI